MNQFNQWLATATEILVALGQTPRAGATIEAVPSSQGSADFWLVEKLAVAANGYSRLDVKVWNVRESQIRAFLTNRGESVPTTIALKVRPSQRGGLFNDEVIVVDSSSVETQL